MEKVNTLPLWGETLFGERKQFGTIEILLTNTNKRIHISEHISDPMQVDVIKQRIKMADRRMLHITDDAACIHELQEEMATQRANLESLDAKMDRVISLLEKRK